MANASTATADPLAEFHELSKPVRPKCGVGIALDQLDADNADLLHRALSDETVTGTGIRDWLVRRDIKIAPNTIQRHRRGDCTCS